MQDLKKVYIHALIHIRGAASHFLHFNILLASPRTSKAPAKNYVE